MDATEHIGKIAIAARAAAAQLSAVNGQVRNATLRSCAEAIRSAAVGLQSENTKDLAAAEENNLSAAMIDRLKLTDSRIEAMAVALEEVAAQPDPVGKTIEACNRPNGLRVEKRRVPLGVVGIIFESRPNVTADAAGLCLKSGNACILRGGKEAIHSNLAIADALRAGLESAGLPPAAVTVLDSTDRALVPAMATAEGLIDLIIPRGGEGLIRAVTQAATIPVIKHYNGICHVYVHADADAEMAEAIILNAKTQRPGVCNAAETLLVDAAVAETMLPEIAAQLVEAGVELRTDKTAAGILAAADITGEQIKPATDEDWPAEYLDLILAIKIVPGLDEAIEHINTYGSKHTDAIVTRDIAAARRFVQAVDSASVMVNASTRFSDGGVYGLGAEIGISTDKLHARGPMGAEDLTTYKWIVTGEG
ncbi:MAG: glutamate-5-semialdehyde dehydrogenase, partial [Phycisphaerae bacterium]|nr:glutamate-5-semialdehyde dehydrogenase [Phycisphaerae bacterium]